eukprot:1158554-Pelagomonas_calceolata.AAC.3
MRAQTHTHTPAGPGCGGGTAGVGPPGGKAGLKGAPGIGGGAPPAGGPIKGLTGPPPNMLAPPGMGGGGMAPPGGGSGALMGGMPVMCSKQDIENLKIVQYWSLDQHTWLGIEWLEGMPWIASNELTREVAVFRWGTQALVA